MPLSHWHDLVNYSWGFSLHSWHGSFLYIFILFLIHGIIAFLFTIGLKTKIMTLLLFIFTCSLQSRIWMINDGGDDLLRLLLFICIFLPLNRRASIDDALSKNNSKKEISVFNFWCLFFLFQLLSPYYFSSLLKNSAEWNESFTATYLSLKLKIFAMPLGQWLLPFKSFLKILTFCAIYLEWAGSLLTFFNFIFMKYIGLSRILAVFIFMSFHFFLAFTLNLGMFPIFMICFWVAFLPDLFWKYLFSKLKRNNQYHATIYYDGDCIFCEKIVLILKSFFLLPSVNIKKAQINEKFYNLMRKENTWIVVDNNQNIHTKFSGVIALLKASPLLKYFSFMANNSIIKMIGDKIYLFVSLHRKSFSMITKYLSGEKFKKQSLKKINIVTILSNLFAVYCFFCVLFWNLGYVFGPRTQNKIVKKSIEYLHLSQKWNLFSPFPRNANSWPEIQGVLENGEFWDLMTYRPYTGINAQKNFYKSIDGKEWRKYFLVIMDDKNYLKLYAEYLCRRWNSEKIRPVNSPLKRLTIFLYQEKIVVNNEASRSFKKLSWPHYCL